MLVFARSTHVGTREVVPSPRTYSAGATDSPRSKSKLWGSKIFEFAPFCQFHLKMRRNFLKTVFFDFWTKAMLLLNPFSTRILWKICILKKTKIVTLNGCISKPRPNSELKLIFAKISLSFLHSKLFSARSTRVGTQLGALPPRTPNFSAASRWPASKS